jgi:hypothetical protein
MPWTGLRPMASYYGDKEYRPDIVWSCRGDERQCLLGGGGGGNSPGQFYLLEELSSMVHAHRILHSKHVLTRRCSYPGKIMMLFRHVPQVQRHRAVVRLMPYSSAQCQGRVGSYCCVPSWLVLKNDATRDPRWAMLSCIGEPPGMGRPGSPSLVLG